MLRLSEVLRKIFYGSFDHLCTASVCEEDGYLTCYHLITLLDESPREIKNVEDTIVISSTFENFDDIKYIEIYQRGELPMEVQENVDFGNNLLRNIDNAINLVPITCFENYIQVNEDNTVFLNGEERLLLDSRISQKRSVKGAVLSLLFEDWSSECIAERTRIIESTSDSVVPMHLDDEED